MKLLGFTVGTHQLVKRPTAVHTLVAMPNGSNRVLTSVKQMVVSTLLVETNFKYKFLLHGSLHGCTCT